MENQEYLFERCLIRYAYKKFIGNGVDNYTEFAKSVFMGVADPVTTFRSVRQGKPKPRRIRLDEAIRMAQINKTDIASLCFNVQKEIENGWSLADDFKPEDGMSGPKGKRKPKTDTTKIKTAERNFTTGQQFTGTDA